MKMKAIISLGCLLVTLHFGSADITTKLQVAEDVYVTKMSAAVYLHETYAELPGIGRTGANGLIVADGSEGVLIDTPWNNALTAVLCDWLKQTHGIVITHVIVGHSHSDCLGGLEEMHRRGARSFGHALCAEFARKAGRPVPQVTFTDTLTLHVGDRELRLYYVGPGHTRDNIVTWLAREKILFAGCLVKALNWSHLGYLKEGDPEAYPDTIRRLIELFPDAAIVVPGHGESGDRELLDHTLKLAEKL